MARQGRVQQRCGSGRCRLVLEHEALTTPDLLAFPGMSIAGVMPKLVATVMPTPTGVEAGYGIGVSDVGLGASLAR